MEIVETKQALNNRIAKQKEMGKTIGFVPTMGYLHEGHGSLVLKAKEQCDYVVLSIFVNPLQFGPNEDFETYPRDLEKDSKYAEQLGVDLIFHPSVTELYPQYPSLTIVKVNSLTNVLCGASRPGHFDGVTTIVNKLFHIVAPDSAFFGLKDAQQVAVITQMVQDLNMNVRIVSCPIVREPDGLAKSSRNVYLNTEEREQAVVLSQSIDLAKQQLQFGNTDFTQIRAEIHAQIKSQPLANIDYIEILSFPSLSHVEKAIAGEQIIIALAVKFGKTRLIDNCIVTIGS